MTAYKTDQRWLIHDGREFHFVSYEGVPPKAGDPRPATPPSWFLVAGNRRWPVMPQVVGQPEAELDRDLHRWLDSTIPPRPTVSSRAVASQRRMR